MTYVMATLTCCRQTNTQTDKHTDRQTHKHTDLAVELTLPFGRGQLKINISSPQPKLEDKYEEFHFQCSFPANYLA